MNQNRMPGMTTPSIPALTSVATKRDYELGALAGLFIGFLVLPIFATAKPELFGKVWFLILAFFLIGSLLGLFIAEKLSSRVPVIWQIAKFALIGVLNTLVDIGVLAAIMALLRNVAGIRPETILFDAGLFIIITVYSLYKAISFIVANINSFIWNKYWTFGAKEKKNEGVQFAQFFVVSLLGFFINNFFASYVFVSIPAMGGMTPEQWGLIGAAIGSIAGLVWNFLGYKFIVFKR